MVLLKTKKLAVKSLFDFQQSAVENVNRLIAAGEKKILLISLMGSGKTVMAAHIINDYFNQGKRCLFMVDIKVLIEQISAELDEWELPYSILQGEKDFNPASQVIIASAQTIDARMKQGFSLDDLLGNLDIIFYDEAHNLTYRDVGQKVYNQYTKNTPLLGLTATPWRLKGSEYLGEFYKKVIETLQPPELVRRGRCCPARIFGFEDYFNLDEISRDLDGDYSDEDMAKQGIQLKNLEKAYAQWEKLTPGHTTIAFCATVIHAIAIADYFNSQGVPSAYITGETTDKERKALIAQLNSGELTLLASINTLNAGFNCPRVSSILYIRLNRSKSLYHQCVGRGSRVYPGKEFFYVLDFGANYKRLRNPMEYQDYSIDKKMSYMEDVTKICGGCGESVWRFTRICPHCGYEFYDSNDVEDESEYEDNPLDLDLEMVEYFSKEDRRRLHWLRTSKKDAYANLTHPELVAAKFKSRFGFLPPNDWYLHAVLGENPTKQEIEDYTEYLKLFAPHEFWVKAMLISELGSSMPKPRTGKRSERNSKSGSSGDKPPKKQQFTSTAKWWQVLGCQANSKAEDVKSKYRDLAKRWHPDVCADKKLGEERFKIINNAYEEFLLLGRA